MKHIFSKCDLPGKSTEIQGFHLLPVAKGCCLHIAIAGMLKINLSRPGKHSAAQSGDSQGTSSKDEIGSLLQVEGELLQGRTASKYIACIERIIAKLNRSPNGNARLGKSGSFFIFYAAERTAPHRNGRVLCLHIHLVLYPQRQRLPLPRQNRIGKPIASNGMQLVHWKLG